MRMGGGHCSRIRALWVRMHGSAVVVCAARLLGIAATRRQLQLTDRRYIDIGELMLVSDNNVVDQDYMQAERRNF